MYRGSDQVHTTGMDIKHVLSAKAVVTLGKDMVFRDYSQGAWRMRQVYPNSRIASPLVLPSSLPPSPL